jgi:hypothetical protein
MVRPQINKNIKLLKRAHLYMMAILEEQQEPIM